MSNKLNTSKLLSIFHFDINLAVYRSSCLQVLHKFGVLENLAKFKEQHLCQGIFNKAEDFQPAGL